MALLVAHTTLLVISCTGSFYFTEGRTNLLREANCFSRGSIPVFLMTPIATCDFPRGGGGGGGGTPGPAHAQPGMIPI